LVQLIEASFLTSSSSTLTGGRPIGSPQFQFHHESGALESEQASGMGLIAPRLLECRVD
jgi:hypothetical protein